ncbi:MAG: hypothetical protein PHU81_07785 [Acidobacteriota bacterium]|nr:hypothetical protein [Acidobacteriota bacterium]
MKRQESIARPDFQGPEIPDGRLIFIPFMPFQRIISDIRKKARLLVNLHRNKLYYLEHTAILDGPVGASSCVNSIEKIRQAKLKEIVVLSYCGSLSEQLSPGQLFVPLSALSEEGTSSHYVKRKSRLYQASPQGLEKLLSHLTCRHWPYTAGRMVSTDAPYRETPAWVKRMQKKGVQTVDMEISAVFSFAEFYQLEAAGLFIVSDQLSTAGWQNQMNSQHILSATEHYFLPLIFEP